MLMTSAPRTQHGRIRVAVDRSSDRGTMAPWTRSLDSTSRSLAITMRSGLVRYPHFGPNPTASTTTLEDLREVCAMKTMRIVSLFVPVLLFVACAAMLAAPSTADAPAQTTVDYTKKPW